jgi:hypothetical protein
MLMLRITRLKISSSSPECGRRCWAAELERRYAGENARGEVGISIAPAVEAPGWVFSRLGFSSRGESCSKCGPRRSCSVEISSATLFELRRDRMAGVCGVWGEMGFPGDDAVEIEVPEIIGGTPESCLLEEVDERCKCIDDDIESESAALESLMRWNRPRATEAEVGFRWPSWVDVELLVFMRFFPLSSSFRNSEIFSSSAWKDSALVPVSSASRPEPGCTFEEAALTLPLESSSVLAVPPVDGRPRRWLKELL